MLGVEVAGIRGLPQTIIAAIRGLDGEPDVENRSAGELTRVIVSAPVAGWSHCNPNRQNRNPPSAKPAPEPEQPEF